MQICDKQSFISRKAAKKGLHQMTLKKKAIGGDVYYCYICRAWHITSMPKERSRFMRDDLNKKQIKIFNKSLLR